MQNLIAITISLLATAWLFRALTQRFFAPPCQPPSIGGPPGSDGFVPLEQVRLKNRPPSNG